MKKFQWLPILIAIVFPAASFAGDDAIAPWIPPDTIVVFHVDIPRLDMDVITAWWMKSLDNSKLDEPSIDAMKKDAAANLAKARDWVAQFKKAGGKDAYEVPDLGVWGTDDLWVIPLAQGADSAALLKLMSPAQGEVVGNNLIVAQHELIEKFKAAKIPARPDLTEPLAINPDAPIHIAMSPLLLGRFSIMFSPGNQNSPSVDFKSAKWAAITINPPPKGSINVTIRCNDAKSAATLAATVNDQIATMKQNHDAQQRFGDHLEKFAAALKPTIDGDKLSISLDQELLSAILPVDGVEGFELIYSQDDVLKIAPRHLPATEPDGPEIRFKDSDGN